MPPRFEARGAARFEPGRHAPLLLPDDALETFAPTPAARTRLAARLRAELRSERRRGRSGHWSYDLNRHLGLLQAVKALRDAPQ